MTGIDAAGQPGVQIEHPVHAPGCGERLVPVVFHAERDARRHAVDYTIEHRRGDARDDDRCRECLGKLERLRDGLRVGVVEAARAHGRRLEAALSDGTRRHVGVVTGVTEPDLDERQPKPRELVEGIVETTVPKRIRVACNPHLHRSAATSRVARAGTARASKPSPAAQ